MFCPPAAIVWNPIEWHWSTHAINFAIFVVTYFILSWVFPGVFARSFLRSLVHLIYRLKVLGKENLPKTGALLISNHVTKIDWLFILVSAPRRVRIFVWAGYLKNPIWRMFLAWYRTIPIEGRRPSIDDIDKAFGIAKKALEAGELVLMFPEARLTRNGFMRPFQRGLELLMAKCPVPIIPVGICNGFGSSFSHAGGKIIWKWPNQIPRHITVCFGKPLPPDTPAVVVRQHVQRTMAYGATHGNHWIKPVHRRFVRVAASRPFRSCWIDPMNKRELNYGKALAGCIVLRNWLRKKLGPEKMVGIWLPSSLGGALANVAVTLLGKVAVNLNYTSSGESNSSCVKQTGIRQVLSAKLFVKRVPFEVPHHEAAPDGDKVQVIYLEDALGEIKNWQRVLTFLMIVALPGWVIEYLWLRLGSHKLHDLLTIIFSSGSTGEPKGIMLSHLNVGGNIDSAIAAVNLNQTDRALGSLPFFHSFGYTVTLWGPLQIAASCAYYPDPRQAKEIGEVVRNYKCTVMVATATFLRFYMKRTDPEDLRSLRLLVCGAEKLPHTLAEEFQQRFGILPLEGYGCTELSPIAAVSVPDVEILGVKQIGRKIGSVGQAIPMVAAKIVDPETLKELDFNQEGLLMMTGPNVMMGYWQKPELTRQVIVDGWYATGDMGKMDEDGFITLTGRISRFAKVAGEMVPLEKIEEELHAALGTNDRFLAVTAIPDSTRGERLVVLHLELPGSDPKQLCQKLAASNLPNLWIPKDRDFALVSELPILGSGKLDLQRVKKLALEKFSVQ